MRIASASTALLLLLTAACSDDPAPEKGAADVAVDVGADLGDIAATDVGADAADVADADVADADVEPDLPLEPLPEQPWDVMEPGFYGVGYRSIDFTYTPAGMDEVRELRASVWYPTRDRGGDTATYSAIIPRADVLDNARVALEAPAPVLIFSHGNQAFAEQSFFLTEYFASHGWIVIAPSHEGNTIFDNGDRPSEMFEWRPQDVSRALDAVRDLPEDDPLAGLLSDDVILSGHSYGGYTTLAVAGGGYDVEAIDADCGIVDDDEGCAYFMAARARYEAGFRDERIKVAIPMAPGNARALGAGAGDIDIPVLHMTGLLDKQTTEESSGTPFWAALNGPDDLRVQFLTAGHLTFSDGCTLVPGTFQDDGCGPEFLDSELAHQFINAYAMAYARKHLWGDPEYDDLLGGARSLHPDIELSRHDD
jgi:predicted dienelactone hydrolase